jgi:cation transport ATPase
MPPSDATPLSKAVATAADLATLSDDERRRLGHWLADRDSANPMSTTARRRRRLTLTIVTSAAAVLIAWLVWLSATLPSQYTAHQWRAAWVGFDIALLASFAFTAWSAWRYRQAVVAALIVTATLLMCDAWFDLTMSWGTSEQRVSILTAVLGEIPLAVLFCLIAARLMRQVASYVWRLAGRPGDPPRLRRLPILLLAARPDDAAVAGSRETTPETTGL